jgi:RND superfamily putative drug exporter
MANWTKAIIKHRFSVVTTWLLLIVIGGFAATNLNQHLTTSLSVPSSESAKAQDILLINFDENLEGGFTIFFKFKQANESEISEYKARISAAVAEIPTARITQMRAISGVLFASVTTNYSLIEAAKYTDELRQSLAKQGLPEAMVTGPPAINSDVSPVLDQDLRRGQLIAMTLALLLLLLVLGLSWAVLLPFIFAAATISLSLSLIYLIAQKFLMVLYLPNIVELIGLGLAIDYSLLILYRFRRELQISENSDINVAIERTMNSAGRTVMTSSLTVAFGLATLLLLPIPFMRSLGIAGLLVPLASLIASLTLQPALLSYFGRYFATPNKYPGLLANREFENNSWAKVARLSVKWPKRVFAISLTSLLLLGSGAFWLQLTPSALTALPQNLESAKALSLVTSSAGPGVITPAVIMVDFGKPGLATAASTAIARKALTAKLSKDPEIFIVATDVTSTFVDSTGQFMRIFVIGRHSLGAPETHDLVDRIRTKHLSDKGFPAGTKFYLGGPPAQGADLLDRITTYFPWLIGLALLLTYFLLLRAFRSIWLPLKAIALGLISVAVAISAIVWVFRYSIGSAWLSTYQIDQVEIWALVFLLVVLFGISMDYEVFLVSRMREAIERGANNDDAIIEGMANTGGVVTAAALIFVAAVSGLVGGHFLGLQQIGIGLAVGVFIDATLIRAFLLPSSMVLLGKYNWRTK